MTTFFSSFSFFPSCRHPIRMKLFSFINVLFLFHLVQCLENTFVIEFDRPVSSFASKRHILNKRSIFYEQLNVYNISYDIRHEYNVINAVSIQFKTPRDSSVFFEKALGVKRAWPVVNHHFKKSNISI